MHAVNEFELLGETFDLFMKFYLIIITIQFSGHNLVALAVFI